MDKTGADGFSLGIYFTYTIYIMDITVALESDSETGTSTKSLKFLK